MGSGLQRPVFAAVGFWLAWRAVVAFCSERGLLFRLGAGRVIVRIGLGLTHATIVVATGASGILKTI
jgi:hypothetical protein